MPVRAVGKTTLRMVCQRVAPKPREASRNRSGTAARASRAMAVMVGSTMIVKTKTAGSMPGPCGGVLNNGMLTPLRCSQDARAVQQRDQHGEAPQTVDDAGDGGEQFDGRFDEPLDGGR
jgi:hypothetical protein